MFAGDYLFLANEQQKGLKNYYNDKNKAHI